MAATQAVLNTYELLEAIITFMPVQEIHRAKAVNRAWHHLITDSKKIRRVAVLTPVVLETKSAVERSNHAYYWSQNPRMGPQYSTELHTIRQNPVFERKITGRLTTSIACERLQHQDSKCLEYITMPPCSLVGVLLIIEVRSRVYYDNLCAVYDPDGISIGMVLEAVNKMYAQAGPSARLRDGGHTEAHVEVFLSGK